MPGVVRGAAAAAMMSDRMRLQLSGVEISVDGRAEPCDTEIVSAGAYVIAVTTVIGARGRLLASSFLTDLSGRAAATHLWSGTGLRRFEHDAVELASVHHGRTCVLEHAARLRQLLAEELGDAEVRVDVPDRVLTDAESVWQTGL